MPPKPHSSAQKTPSTRCMRSNSGAASTSARPTRDSPPREETLHVKCERALDLLQELDLSFGDFVLAVSYGEPSLRNVSSAKEARASLYREDVLSKFLELCFEPPRPPSGGGMRPVGGSKVTRCFVFTKAKDTLRSELATFSEDYKLPNDQLANIDYINTISSNALHQRVKLHCPELYATLSALTVPRPPDTEYEVEEDEDEDGIVGPRKPPIERHPHFDIVFQVTSMAYRLNPHRNMLQKILTVYLHAKHTSKAAIDLLHQGGHTMSYSWVCQQVSNLSRAIREETILAAHINPFLVVHDNIRLKYGVRSQRGDNQTVSDNGTASTIIILPESARALQDADDFGPFLRTLRAKRRAGTAPRLCYQDISQPAQRIANRTAYIYDILDMFAKIPELSGSALWESDKLKRPVGPQQLPHGPEHRLKQYMLPVTNIDESSYSGNSQFVLFLLKQLQLETLPERTRLVLELLIIWIGDQMTVQRCRQVQAFRQESIDGFHRWDSLLFIFGGLHCLMALALSLLELYRGSNIGATFGADIIALSRTGLQKQTGNLDYHTVEELLQHECEASFRGLFDELTGCQTSEARTDWVNNHTAQDLYNLAVRALTEHASSGALELDESGDELHALIVKRQRDLLLYYSIRRAFKYGDIDRIEAILPELLYFFIGAGNGNYAKEVYELLQLLTHETTPAVRAAILQHGLLVNKLGRADTFYPIDQRQELNNKGIREYGPPPQNSSWEQYGKVSRVIPLYMDVIDHVESRITGIARSHIHKEVKREIDIDALIKEHHKHQIHAIVPGRAVKPTDKVKDVRKAGITAVRERRYLEELYEKRAAYFKYSSTLQEQEYIETPPPSPVRAPQPPRSPSPKDLEDEGSLSRSTGRPSPLDEVGVSPNVDSELAELATRVAELALGDSGEVDY